MRIGQVAALVGVSPRTLRHYHRIGVLPEPDRDPNGYRRYSIADVVRSARARRLCELGLSLDEVGEALRDSDNADLDEILAELDADLAAQAERIAGRRARLAEFRRRLASDDDPLRPAWAARLADRLRNAGVSGPAAELDLQLMSLVPEDVAEHVVPGTAGRPTAEEQERLRTVYRRFDALTGGDPAGPEVAALAADIVAGLPADLKQEVSSALDDGDAVEARMAASPIGDVVAETLTPAQIAVLTAVMERLARR
ncbi:MAG: MerR family transcriptional regulator [Gordonia sp. (in: high G+C Gram-positive bacteria)]|uniref:helix-turn-helix domain-containing protein n=1 Tax=Gordonia sp. (in: high G+C Gram-positive bacteria) TaxID=84139 RepID=UPI0039E3B005